MTDPVPDNVVLEKCVEDILGLIKPAEDDRNKRLSAILELEKCMHSREALRGVAVKPFGSFVSDLYSKSGDLDLSVQVLNGSNLPINKKKKQNILREVQQALRKNGVPRNMQLIGHARVPVLQYVSNLFGVSCDISIDNYAGRIKSKIFYWVNTLDDRFGDIVLLIKEWAKAQNINDPKTGSLNSYSLCLLVLFHFQTSEPPILPPMKEIYEGNIAEDITEGASYNEEQLDEVCAANIEKFQLQNKGQRNESSLCRLLATFFHKFNHIDALPDAVISTYTGQFVRTQDNPSRKMMKSYHLFVEDPVERPDNAARAVSMGGLHRIASAFNDANRKFESLEHVDWNELLALLCTPDVVSKLGGRVIARPYTNTPHRNHQQTRPVRRWDRDQRLHEARSVHKSPQENTTVHQTAVQNQNRNRPRVHTPLRHTAAPYQNRNYPQAYTAGHQTTPYQNHSHPHAHPNWPQIGGQHQNHHQQIHTTGFQRPYRSHDQVYATEFQTEASYHNHNQQFHTPGFETVGTYQNHNQQIYPSGSQAAGLHQNQHQRNGYRSNHSTNRHTGTARYEPVRGQLYNGSTLDSRSQASNSAASHSRSQASNGAASQRYS